MRRAKFTFKIIYFTAFIMLLFTTSAHAYIDPAATTYLMQVIAGIFIACGVALGIFWKRIRLFFRNLKLKALEKKLVRQAEKSGNIPLQETYDEK